MICHATFRFFLRPFLGWVNTGALSRKEQQSSSRKRSRAGGEPPLHSPVLTTNDQSLEGLVSGECRGRSRKFLHLADRGWGWVRPP